MKKIAAIDFDGTLCESKYPLIGKPKDKVIEYVNKLKETHTLVLWTCRRGVYLQTAVDWCAKHGLEFDYVNENAPSLIKMFNGDCRKIFADVYIDDKAMNVSEIEGG